MRDAPPSFAYVVSDLPPGRFPFRRWRWELWDGALLLAAGWVTSPARVERALRIAAARKMHQRAGVIPLRPDRAQLLEPLAPGCTSRLETGVGPCLLVAAPLGEPSVAAA